MVKDISILGCGWLGLPLAESLVKKGYSVKGSTTTKSKLELLKSKGVEPYLIDSKDLNNDSYSEFLKSDLLIVSTTPQSRVIFRTLAEDVAASPIKQLIFVGSTAVYPSVNDIVNEEEAEYIKSPHSGRVMKSLEDVFVNQAAFETTVLRFGGLFGPGRVPGKFMAGFEGLSGGDNPVNMIHLDDCVGVINAVIEKNAWGEVFNACAPVHPTRKEFYITAAQKAGVEPPKFNAVNQDKNARYKIVDSTKLIKKLEYKFIYPDPLSAL